jgi:hypothetical protein
MPNPIGKIGSENRFNDSKPVVLVLVPELGCDFTEHPTLVVAVQSFDMRHRRLILSALLIPVFMLIQVPLVVGTMRSDADWPRFFLRPGGWFAELTRVTDSTTVIPGFFQWAVVLGFNSLLYVTVCAAVSAFITLVGKRGSPATR